MMITHLLDDNSLLQADATVIAGASNKSIPKLRDMHRLVLISGMALGNFGSQFSALIASDAARSPESTAPSIAPLNAVEVSVPAQ